MIRSTPPDVVRDTPYQKIKNSPVGRFVRENKVVSGVAAVGSAIVVAGASAQSPAFEQVARYGIVPAAGAGAALFGAAAVQDAFVNDLGRHNVRAAGKIAGGSLLSLGGTEIVGSTFNIPLLDRALSGTLEHIARNGEGLMGAAVIGGGLAAGRFAVDRFQRAATHPEHRGANALLGLTASGASAGGVLGGLQLVGDQYHIAGLDRVFSHTIDMLSGSGLGAAAGGALLLAGSGVLAGEAAQNLRKGGNDFVTVAEGMGAASAGLGGAELLGHGLGIPALAGLFTAHVETIGAAGMTATGVAMTRNALASMEKNGLTARNALTATLGSTLAVGGLGVAADSFRWVAAANMLGHGCAVAGGVGLGAVAAAQAHNAIGSFRQGDLASGAASAVGSTLSGAASLGLVGGGLGIDAVSRLGEKLFDHTAVPLWDHVIEPAGRFLFQNPLAGAVVLAAGVGAYAWYRHAHTRP